MKMKICFLLILVITKWSVALPGVSQQMKIGVFDLDSMVHALPEYRTIDSLVLIYEDNEIADYEILVNELSRFDRIFLQPHEQFNSSYIDSIVESRKQLALSVVYRKPTFEQNKRDKARRFLEPLYEKVQTAYKKVIAGKNYDVILKPTCILAVGHVDNLFVDVAKELHLPSLPNHLINLSTGDIPY